MMFISPEVGNMLAEALRKCNQKFGQHFNLSRLQLRYQNRLKTFGRSPPGERPA
jgi:hypothetical protein